MIIDGIFCVDFFLIKDFRSANYTQVMRNKHQYSSIIDHKLYLFDIQSVFDHLIVLFQEIFIFDNLIVGKCSTII